MRGRYGVIFSELCCLLFCSDTFVPPCDSAVGDLMRRKTDLNSKILQSRTTVLLIDNFAHRTDIENWEELIWMKETDVIISIMHNQQSLWL